MSITDDLLAKELGHYVLNHLQQGNPSQLPQRVDSRAVALLEKIQQILDDPTLADPECFCRMEELLALWNQAGLTTSRHHEFE